MMRKKPRDKWRPPRGAFVRATMKRDKRSHSCAKSRRTSPPDALVEAAVMPVHRWTHLKMKGGPMRGKWTENDSAWFWGAVVPLLIVILYLLLASWGYL